MGKSVWLLSAGLFALATPVHAQETDTDQGTAQPTDGATAEAAAVDNQATEQVVDQSTQTGDIVVTATRRNEALSDVPLAVSAVTAETLENSGINDIRQLIQVSPSLLVSSTSSEAGAGVARIRGIGTVGDNPGLESSVATFIDGVYRSRTGVGLTELGPGDRIEVQRGPQGTLFGRNASAGIISVITAKPRFQTMVNGQIDIGNYDSRRIEVGVTGPLSETIAARIDGVYMKRDGFIENSITGEEVNNRDRWLLRGQTLFQPSEDLSIRLIADYAKRDEQCCAAPYLPASDFTAANGREPSTIKPLMELLGAEINDDPYERKASWTEGYGYDSDVKDGGLSGEVIYDFGGAELTSITAYRYNKWVRGTDADYNNLDILHRAPDGNSYNRFKTFTQEARLQGTTFGGKLDWLIGGYYANEKLQVRDNLEYGSDYERFANCLLINSVLPSALAPSADPASSCISVPVVQGTIAFLQGLPPGDPRRAGIPLLSVLIANPARPGFGSLAAVLGLPTATLNGAGLDDLYNQESRNFALFTHNIFAITDRLDLTVGARWTREKKTLDASFSDDNVICRALALSGLPAPFQSLAGLQRLPCFNPAVPGGDFNPERSKKTESKLSGTVVLSYKPTDNLLTYASYSRGYKAGGFNFDRAGLTRQQLPGSAGPVLPTASLDDLQFKPETNDAFELGAKYNGRGIDVNVAAFNQLFDNFQLNTFDGTKFIVENINACDDDLDGADTDNDPATGGCDGDLRRGVRSRGVEIEVFTRPMSDLSVNLGATMVGTKYRKNLVGAGGRPLTNALFQLPGRRVSNSSAFVATGAIAYNPMITGNGLRALFYIDGRHQTKFNTGSDLDLEKIQKRYTVFNARVGIQGPDRAWAVELWAQNLLDKNYQQVAFDAFGQGSGTQRGVEQGFYTRSNQLFGTFLADPRTYGITLRGKFGPSRAAAPEYVAPPAPPPPPPATQTCADGTVIEATASCPVPPPPPPPPPAEGERG
ncbi:TonB-dependent receptor domain-containing protein [Sphingomonas sp.]|uniref:TonB-dependent receptor domain-containing protein n=1 Tax=Sphingomonas sp. TaxID=28214 RepID=UPI00286D8ADE|nr:TonB-dependent receptor [Sphingomonas sp.]